MSHKQLPKHSPDKPEQIATKAPRHKTKPLFNTNLCFFVSWWREGFNTKYTKIISKILKIDNGGVQWQGGTQEKLHLSI